MWVSCNHHDEVSPRSYRSIGERGYKYVTDLLHYFSSFSYSSFEAVKTLMEYNADPSLKDADGATSLHFAARHGCVETSTLLLSNSLSSVNCPDNSGMTPFHLACARGSLELCELFLEHGADIRARTVEEKTSLHLAALHGNQDTVQLLIKEGGFKRVCSRFLPSLYSWYVCHLM